MKDQRSESRSSSSSSDSDSDSDGKPQDEEEDSVVSWKPRFNLSATSRFQQSGLATIAPMSKVSELKGYSTVKDLLPLSVEEIADIYIVAWRAALTQQGRFLAPRKVFEGIATGLDLVKEVCTLAPFLWVAEKKLRDDTTKAELRNCYKAMKDEADTICQAEFLSQHGTNRDLKQMESILAVCRRRRYVHEAVYELEQKKVSLESKAADHLLHTQLGGRAAAYRSTGPLQVKLLSISSHHKAGRRDSVSTNRTATSSSPALTHSFRASIVAKPLGHIKPQHSTERVNS
eukprot:Protomagalhaensia_wolfi_Nauph_80__1818@NODE_2133_length_1203_cov_172_954467_g1669_i0_p1_GENE_NODE_2133_length_1203_cov_172_954467_g1669_i0NODE_2133_length_1203_cov_172_954467_g1669_i0_p1_ORF_typecomplete_len288_score77_97IMUP/PF15761_5/0_24IMUP/PF15761_5/4_2e03_NODE_2133_length_1203_cov_172_954467_g1669_i056919